MYQQKSNTPRNPFMYYSGFKLAIYFNNKKDLCKPFHSVETKATIAQVHYQKIDKIVLDRRAGFYYCIEIVEKMKDKIHCALLYSAYDGELLYGKFIAGKWFMQLEPDFSDQNRLIVSNHFSIKNGFVILHDIEANLLAYQSKKQSI